MPRPLPPPKRRFGWRMWLRLTLGAGLAAGLAYGAREVNSFFTHDPRFSLSSLDIHGAVYTNRARIQDVFATDMNASVFRLPLAERRRYLLAVDWVKTASVSRVWPDRIIVTVTERKPVAFAKLPVGNSNRYRFTLIDREGVLLSLPPRVRFRLPVLSGIREEEPESERRVRVEAMQHLLDDLGPQAKEISEINARDPEDMRIITDIDNRAVELWIGDQHYRSRYVHFMASYPEIRQHSDAERVFDLRMDDRILAK